MRDTNPGELNIFLNKLKLNRIHSEKGQSRLVWGKARFDMASFFKGVTQYYVFGAILLAFGLALLYVGKIKIMLFLSSLGAFVIGYRNRQSLKAKKAGNSKYKYIEDGELVLVNDDGKVFLNKNNIEGIFTEDTIYNGDQMYCSILIMSDNTIYSVLELNAEHALADTEWVVKFLTKYLSLEEDQVWVEPTSKYERRLIKEDYF